MNELQELLLDLKSPVIALELVGLAGCLVLAWGLSWALGRQYTGTSSILFGRRLVDGVLFPVLALVLTYGVKLILMKLQRVSILKVALPVLVSLVLIRLIARVLAAVFPDSRAHSHCGFSIGGAVCRGFVFSDIVVHH
jgi:hypothetical protein